jgi:hypothetical protein
MDAATQALLDERAAESSKLLDGAIRLDFRSFLGRQLEDRLRARPNFLARTPTVTRISWRKAVNAEADRAAEKMAQPVRDLRVFLGASPRSEAEETAALAKTLGEIVEVARRMLIEGCFPGDDKADRADVTQVDLDAEWALAYAPSPPVVWAWRQVRELDEVRNQLADDPNADTFEIRWHLPEYVRPKK